MNFKSRDKENSGQSIDAVMDDLYYVLQKIIGHDKIKCETPIKSILEIN